MKTLTIGFLGCGGIGSGVWNLLLEMKDEIARREGLAVRVKKVLVRDISRTRQADIPRELLTADAREVIDDPEISLVMEFMGGEEPALTYLCRALLQGKSVVTANKNVLALGWERLFAAAAAGGAGLYFEAAVCGAIPIIRVLEDSLGGNRVGSLLGIVNGTTNYILSQMSESGREYKEVLAEAQVLGFAEPDPSGDVDGFDAAYKLSILGTLAFRQRLPFAAIRREGIAGITKEDVALAREFGYAIKLLAVASLRNGVPEARVAPALLPLGHRLSGVQGAFNAVLLRCSAAGDLMFYGRGAGSRPTAGALVGDLLFASRQDGHRLPRLLKEEASSPGGQGEIEPKAAFCLRFEAQEGQDAQAHVQMQLATHGIGIEKLLLRSITGGRRSSLGILTGPVDEGALETALASIDPSRVELKNRLRVEGMGEA